MARGATAGAVPAGEAQYRVIAERPCSMPPPDHRSGGTGRARLRRALGSEVTSGPARRTHPRSARAGGEAVAKRPAGPGTSCGGESRNPRYRPAAQPGTPPQSGPRRQRHPPPSRAPPPSETPPHSRAPPPPETPPPPVGPPPPETPPHSRAPPPPETHPHSQDPCCHPNSQKQPDTHLPPQPGPLPPDTHLRSQATHTHSWTT